MLRNAITDRSKAVVLLWFSVACFGVRVSVTFHLTCVHNIFNSVWVAEWPPFGKELPTLLAICALYFLQFEFRNQRELGSENERH